MVVGVLSHGRARVHVSSRPLVFNVKALRFISRPGIDSHHASTVMFHFAY